MPPKEIRSKNTDNFPCLPHISLNNSSSERVLLNRQDEVLYGINFRSFEVALTAL
ncbi:MAG: hypothetical protein WC216_01905 [Gallionella sp.]|jgi:hypothetical protein